jgi:hypothetical protein
MMIGNQLEQTVATCQCGKVRLAAAGLPILTAACHCADCQEAGRQLEQAMAAPAVRDGDGGTSLVLYRKDRVQCLAGSEYLREHRLKPHSPTRRVFASCCNSAMFLDFNKGHWLSLYRNRFAAGAPRVQMRIVTKERRPGVEFSDGLPSTAGHSGKFLRKLLIAWIAMGFRRPDIALGKTQ